MEVKDRLKLQKNYDTLIEVMYCCISPHLISKFILDPEMHADIESRRTERRKMDKLLSILPTRGGTAMKEFIAALKPNYSWLAKQLENDDENNNKACISTHERDVEIRLELLKDISISEHIREIEAILHKSTRVCSHWTMLANSMGLKPTITMDIRRDMIYSGGVEYAIHSILNAWVDHVGKKATFRGLISHLQRQGMAHTADEVKELWMNLQE